ncbi:murein biosynthesis integral membrane protein MurJ [Actinomycetota bacterium]
MSPAGRRAAGVAGGAGLIAAATLLARVVGFGRWLVQQGTVGTTCTGTAYASANLLPNVLYEVAAGGALAAVVVPLVGARLARGERREADAVASALLTWTLLILVPLAVLLALLAQPLAGLLVDEGAGCAGMTALAADLIRVFAPQIPLYGLGIVVSGVLQAHRRFLGVALAPLLSSLVVIASYVWFGLLADGRQGQPGALSGTAVAVLAWGTTLGVAALSIPLLAPAARAGVRLRPALALDAGERRRVAHLAGAGMVGLLAQQAAVLTTLALSNRQGGIGVINIYQYVQAVYVLPYAVLAVPVAMAAFPALVGRGVDAVGAVTEQADLTAGCAGADARAAESGGATSVEEFQSDAAHAQTLALSLRVILIAMLASTAALVAAAVPIGHFFGAIGVGSPVLVRETMPAAIASFAPGLIGFGLAALLTRALYAHGSPRAAARWTAIGWLCAVLIPAIALLAGGASGPLPTLVWLGVGSSVGMTLAALGLARGVRAAWGPEALTGLGATLRWTAPATVAGAVGGWLAAQTWQADSMPSMVVSGVVLGVLAAGLVAAAAAAGDPAGLRRLRTAVLRGRG